MSTPKEVVELARKNGARILDIQFVETCGTWQYFTCPIRELNEEVFADGQAFGGSSARINSPFAPDCEPSRGDWLFTVPTRTRKN